MKTKLKTLKSTIQDDSATYRKHTTNCSSYTEAEKEEKKEKFYGIIMKGLKRLTPNPCEELMRLIDN